MARGAREILPLHGHINNRRSTHLSKGKNITYGETDGEEVRFYLGTHRPNWLAQLEIPLFVSHRVLRNYKTLPKACGPWALDSGGFTELSIYGEWQTSEQQYVDAVRKYQDTTGPMDFASPQDWMCEPRIIEKTGLSIPVHQKLTIENYIRLKETGLPFIPVLQGWHAEDYLSHAEMYAEAGVDLAAEPTVGIGSVCRRAGTREAEHIILALQPLRLHGFGLKATALSRFGYLLASADSMAWSFTGRRGGPCPPPSRCTNHQHFALEWRDRVLAAMDYQQFHLGVNA